MQPGGLDVQRKILYIPVVHAFIVFMFLINTMYYGLPVKLQFKTTCGMFGGVLVGGLLFKLIAHVPNGGILGVFISYGILLFLGWWFIRIQKEMGARE